MPNEKPQSYVFHYQKNVKPKANTITLETKQKTFDEAVAFVLGRQEPTEFTPHKMVVTSSGKTLYFDEGFFKSFIQGNITKQELIELTECDGVFRNKQEIALIGKDTIDPDTLFTLHGDKLILVDHDNYVAIEFPDSNFYAI